MKTKQILLIIGLLILLGLLAQQFIAKQNTATIGENGQKITAPGIKQQMCEKNGRSRDKELEKCMPTPN